MTRRNLLKGFKMPKKIQLERSDTDKNYGRMVAYPFERGFGTTVGNTFRRVLLSSIQGYAVTSVCITSYDENDAAHVISSEFESIPKVSEDTIEILNSLKKVRFFLPGDSEEISILYDFKGEGPVMSAELEREGKVEVANKDILLFNMMKGAHFSVEMHFGIGRGYVSAEENGRYVDNVNAIAVDSLFTPVYKVKYSIEPCRVGERSDYDKLVMEIWTDGTITVDDAVGEAAKIVKEYFSIFINFDERECIIGNHERIEDGELKQLLDTPVDDLELSARPRKCIKKANIQTLGELVRIDEGEMSTWENCGKVSINEIKDKLKTFGLTLGMKNFSDIKRKNIEMKEEGGEK